MDGPIEPGTYRVAASPWSAADYSVTIPAGWAIQYGQAFSKDADTETVVGFHPALPDGIWAEACAGRDSGVVDVGPGVDDLVAALLDQEGPEKSEPIPTTLGGYAGTRIDLTVPEGFDLHPCNVQDIGFQVWYSAPADANFVLFGDALSSVYILDVAGERQVFLAQIADAASDADRADLQAVLDSIRIEP